LRLDRRRDDYTPRESFGGERYGIREELDTDSCDRCDAERSMKRAIIKRNVQMEKCRQVVAGCGSGAACSLRRMRLGAGSVSLVPDSDRNASHAQRILKRRFVPQTAQMDDRGGQRSGVTYLSSIGEV